jgi:hypothetical protein
VVGAATLLIGRALGVDDPDVLLAMGVIVGFVPAAVTWIVVKRRKARTP